MSEDTQDFVAWEENYVCHNRGNRLVHYYLKETSENMILAVIGTERSIRHMIYVVADEFMNVYGSKLKINRTKKWRARRDVVNWLQSLVSSSASVEVSTSGLSAYQTCFPDQMVQRKFVAHNSDIDWSGIASLGPKQLKHYPAFYKNGAAIPVHSFVSVMGGQGSSYLGYIEDMYEDKKGHKKVKVRWFHNNHEARSANLQLNLHFREVFISTHVQVIKADCIDSLAIVLTRTHFEKYVAFVQHALPSNVYMCFRQVKNSKIKPFTLTKLRGYFNQTILSSLCDPCVSKPNFKCPRVNDGEELMFGDPSKIYIKKIKSSKRRGLKSDMAVRNLAPCNRISKPQTTYPRLKLRMSRKSMGVSIIEPQPVSPASFQINDEIEILSQDSGIRGCWFRCKILRVFKKHLKVQYQDLLDPEESQNLEELVLACRVANPDNLGMRALGRQTIRPPPAEESEEDSTEFLNMIGAPVDVWWCSGWWEGVVAGIDLHRENSVQVYLPGEGKVLAANLLLLRRSRDWINSKWVDIQPKTDITSYIFANFRSNVDLLESSNMTEGSVTGCNATPENTVPAAPRLEAVEEDMQELENIATSDVTLRDAPCLSDGADDARCENDGVDFDVDGGNVVYKDVVGGQPTSNLNGAHTVENDGADVDVNGENVVGIDGAVGDQPTSDLNGADTIKNNGAGDDVDVDGENVIDKDGSVDDQPTSDLNGADTIKNNGAGVDVDVDGENVIDKDGSVGDHPTSNLNGANTIDNDGAGAGVDVDGENIVDKDGTVGNQPTSDLSGADTIKNDGADVDGKNVVDKDGAVGDQPTSDLNGADTIENDGADVIDDGESVVDKDGVAGDQPMSKLNGVDTIEVNFLTMGQIGLSSK